MLERHPILWIFLIFIGVGAFGLLAIWLWLSVGLIWATLIILAGLLAVPWLYSHRPSFLGGHRTNY